MGLFNKKEDGNTVESKNVSNIRESLQNTAVFKTINENFEFINKTLGTGIDLIEDKYDVMSGSIKAGVVFIETINDKQMIRQHILRPLMNEKPFLTNPDASLELIKARVINAAGSEQVTTMDKIINKLLAGETAIFLESAGSALVVPTRKIEKRAVEKPENEETVMGSQDSFTDDLKTNVCLLIKRLPAPELHAEEFIVGTLTRTKVKVFWLQGIANGTMIGEVKKRIESINVDNIDGIGNLAELIEDKPYSVFPKYRQTERPDLSVNMLAQGRAVILCDNSPFALIVPVTFWDNFKNMDDYDEKITTSSYLRIVRFIALFLATMISPLYLSFVTYNHAIVPPALAINIASGREGVPFPSVVELLLLIFGMSVIREAGLRMPGSVGYFVGTLAAVLIGQAIVQAGYVSASLIIVVAVSAISAFAVSTPTLVFMTLLINYLYIFLAGSFGMFGLINGIIVVFWRLISLESFGMPYLSPVLPHEKESLKDTFVRPGIDFLKSRKKLRNR